MTKEDARKAWFGGWDESGEGHNADWCRGNPEDFFERWWKQFAEKEKGPEAEASEPGQLRLPGID